MALLEVRYGSVDSPGGPGGVGWSFKRSGTGQEAFEEIRMALVEIREALQ